jgi:hypothetical protein
MKFYANTFLCSKHANILLVLPQVKSAQLDEINKAIRCMQEGCPEIAHYSVIFGLEI